MLVSNALKCEEELLAVNLLMKSNYKNDFGPMVSLGALFPILRSFFYPLWLLNVSGVDHFIQIIKVYLLVAEFTDKQQNLEVSLLSFVLYTFNLSLKLLAEKLIVKLLQRRNDPA